MTICGKKCLERPLRALKRPAILRAAQWLVPATAVIGAPKPNDGSQPQAGVRPPPAGWQR